jgi:hypothetical protein
MYEKVINRRKKKFINEFFFSAINHFFYETG